MDTIKEKWDKLSDEDKSLEKRLKRAGFQFDVNPA